MVGYSITELIEAARSGETGAQDELFSAAYFELHRLARAQRRRWHGVETLTTTALIHEAYIKLVQRSGAVWQSRAHFFATASRAMRHILANYAARAAAAKRGAVGRRVSLESDALVCDSLIEEVLELSGYMDKLEAGESTSLPSRGVSRVWWADGLMRRPTHWASLRRPSNVNGRSLAPR